MTRAIFRWFAMIMVGFICIYIGGSILNGTFDLSKWHLSNTDKGFLGFIITCLVVLTGIISGLNYDTD